VAVEAAAHPAAWAGGLPALPLVAILRGITPAEAAAHARVLLDAGFGAIEVPTNSPDWATSVRTIAQLAPHALVGAGTVTRADELDALQAAGGRLAVSPHTDPALIAEAVRRGLVALPGALTPSEVFAAVRAGAAMVKLFPAASLGPAHVKALRAVLPPALPLLAVGGVSPATLVDYLRAGCAGAGLGGELYRPGQSPQATAAHAAAFVAAYRSAVGR
jgi:2-dehydro-3-deoxyphosphogalactonate aldolase